MGGQRLISLRLQPLERAAACLGLVAALVVAAGPVSAFVANCPAPAGILEYGAANRLPNDLEVRYGLAHAADRYGLTLYRIDGPQPFEVVGELALEGEATELAISGNTACLMFHQSVDMAVVDISVPSQPRLVSNIARGDDVVITRGHAVVVADHMATIVDLSDPATPSERSSIQWHNPHSGRARATVHGFNVLIATGTQQLVVIDLSDLDAPRVASILDSEGTTVDVGLFGDLGAVAVRETGLLLVELTGGIPEIVGNAPLPGVERILSSRRIAVAATSDGTVVTVDLSRPRQPEILGELGGFGSLSALAWRSDQVILADPRSGLRRVELGDLRTLSLRPERAPCHGIGSDIVVINTTVIIANGPAGLVLVDVRSPHHPWKLGQMELDGGAQAMALDRDRALLFAAGNSGLHILDVSRPRQPDPAAFLPIPSLVDVEIAGLLAHVLQPDGTVTRVDVADPRHPEIVDRAEVDGPNLPRAVALAVSGDDVLVAGEGLWLHDFAEPQSSRPLLIGTDITALMVHQDRAFAANPYFILGIDLAAAPPEVTHWGEVFLARTGELAWTPATGILSARQDGLGVAFVDLIDTRELEPTDPNDWGHPESPYPPDLTTLAGAIVAGDGPGAFAADPASSFGWVTTKTALTGLDLRCTVCSGITVQASPSQISTGGAQATLIARVTDLGGSPVAGALVEGSATLGSLSPWTEAGDGRYTATLVSGTTSGEATVQVALDDAQCAAATTVTIECATELPSPPSDVSAVPTSDGALQVSWSDVELASAYRVHRGGVVLATLPEDSTAYRMSGLSAGVTYQVAVSVVDPCGRTTAPSTPVEATLPGNPVTGIVRTGYTELDGYGFVYNAIVAGTTGVTVSTEGRRHWDLSDIHHVREFGEGPTGPTGHTDASDVGLVALRDGLVGSAGDGWLRLDDVSDPTNPRHVSYTRDERLCANVYTHTDGAWVFAACRDGLAVVDLSSPLAPAIVAEVQRDLADLAIAGDRLFGIGMSGSILMDVSDPGNPVLLDLPADPRPFTKHVASAGRCMVLAGSTAVQVLDPATGSVVGDAVDLPGRIQLLVEHDDHQVLASDGQRLWTIDVADPTQPVISERLTSSIGHLAVGSSGLLLVTEHGSLRTVDSDTWTVAATLDEQLTDVQAVAVNNVGAVALANSIAGVLLVDASDPTQVTRLPTSGVAEDVAALDDGSFLVADGLAGVTVVRADGSSRTSVSLGGSTTGTPEWISTVEVAGNIAVAGSRSHLHVLDVCEPTAPVLLGTVEAAAERSVSLIGDRVHLRHEIIDLSDPTAPVRLEAPSHDDPCLGADVSGGRPVTFVANDAPLTICVEEADGWPVPVSEARPAVGYHRDGDATVSIGTHVLLLSGSRLHLLDAADPAAPGPFYDHVGGVPPVRDVATNGAELWLASPRHLTSAELEHDGS